MGDPRIFCIGKNYPAHVAEMGDTPPTGPVIFLKPSTCLVPTGDPIRMPRHGGELHHEVELVVRIGKASAPGQAISAATALEHVDGATVGLDLTLRDVQAKLKAAGHPWEVAKAFDGSAPIGALQPVGDRDLHPEDLLHLDLTCHVNGEVRQQAGTDEMIRPLPELIEAISGVWALRPGDLIYTGTPSRVGALRVGDTVEASSSRLGRYTWTVTA